LSARLKKNSGRLWLRAKTYEKEYSKFGSKEVLEDKDIAWSAQLATTAQKEGEITLPQAAAEPPYAEWHVLWCERTAVSHRLLLDFYLSLHVFEAQRAARSLIHFCIPLQEL
jgi:hypothetical protein